MEHDEIMRAAVTIAAAFIHNGDIRHDENLRDDGSSHTQERVTLLLIQMYRAIEEASFEARQASWVDRMKGNAPDPSGTS